MSRIGFWLILSFRLHRWEILASVGGGDPVLGDALFTCSCVRWLSSIPAASTLHLVPSCGQSLGNGFTS